MMKQMNKLEQSNQVYRAGYKKPRAALGKSGMETNVITVPNVNPMVTLEATPVPVLTVITPTTDPIIKPQAPIVTTPQATQGRIITIPQGMMRGTFKILTPPGQNTPAATLQASWVTTTNQGKRLFTPRTVSTTVLNKASFPNKKPHGRPHKMSTTCQALEVEGLGEGEYVFQNEDRSLEAMDAETAELCEYLDNKAAEIVECVEESDDQKEI